MVSSLESSGAISMGVRIRLKIRHNNTEVETTGLVNSGYESDEPEIHIPLALAKKLGFHMERLTSQKYRVVGSNVNVYRLGRVRVCVVGKETSWVEAIAVMVPEEYEVLLSDALIEALDIEILKPKSGIWRFRGEKQERKSSKPEYWVA